MMLAVFSWKERETWSVAVLGGFAVLLLTSGILSVLPSGEEWWLTWGLLALLYPLRKMLHPWPLQQRSLLIIICLYLTFRYLVFRTVDTIGYHGFWDMAAMLALYIAEVHGATLFTLGAIVGIHPLERPLKIVSADDLRLPTVDVLIPTYNEDIDLVKVTVQAALQMIYPSDKFNVFICDDGGTTQKRNDPDPEKARNALDRHLALRALADDLGVRYLTRERNEKAKAGNLNNALKFTESDLLLILDCDHVPTRDLLQNTVGHFMEDEKLFLVQTPHFFINPDPLERNLKFEDAIPSESDMFYGLIQKGLDFWNASFFCGSAALLRRKHLLEVGGIMGETITEDAETALELHSRGYRSVYVSRPMICGLSPETFGDFMIQRNRWTAGMIQIFCLKNPLFKPGLTVMQRLGYLNSCLFWFFGLSRVIYYLAPFAFLFFGLKVYNASFGQVLTYALPHLLGSWFLTNTMYGQVRRPFFSELYETAQCIYNLPAIVGALFRPRAPVFRVTPKNRNLTCDHLSHLAWPFYTLLFFCVATIPAAVTRWHLSAHDRNAVILCIVWSIFNLVFVLLCLGVVWERRQVRQTHRIRTEEKIRLYLGTGERIEAILEDVSLHGARLKTVSSLWRPIEGERFFLEATNSLRQTFRIPALVVRIIDGRGNLLLGCSFAALTPEEEGDVVGFVFGDSERWVSVYRRRRNATGAGSAFLYLFGKGLEGIFVNGKGLLTMVLGPLGRARILGWLSWRHS